MKKLFISRPMKGRTEENIKKSIEKIRRANGYRKEIHNKRDSTYIWLRSN